MIDRPSAADLDQLASLIESSPFDRGRLILTLRRVENGLRERRRDLDQAGGLLDDSDRAARMSLAREDHRLLDELTSLADEVAWFREEVEAGAEERQLRLRGSALLAGMRGHRDAEASLILESADTEVGSGD